MNTALKTTSKATAAILGMALIAGLSACASSAATNAGLHSGTPVASVTSTPAASPVASSAPAPAATTAAPVAVANGTVLTADQAKTLPTGTVAYKMQDGSLVAVVHGQPFPEAVVADVNKVAKATFPTAVLTAKNDDIAGTLAQKRAFNSWIGSTAQALGGGTILVVADYAYYNIPGITAPGRFWVVAQNSWSNTTTYKSQAAAIAGAQDTATKMAPALVVVLTY